MTRPVVVFSVVGSVLDAAKRAWRPTLSLLSDPAKLPVARVELLVQDRTRALGEELAAQIAQHAPATAVRTHAVPVADPWSFEQVYAALYEFCRAYPWDEEREQYLVHITTGTHVMQIVWYLLLAEHYAPARLVQTRPDKTRPGAAFGGGFDVVDLELSAYPALARKKHAERLTGQSFLKHGIATESPGFNALIAQIERAALGPPVPILLTGETGVGKSALARRIYELRKGARKVRGPLVEVNCATLRGQLRESALFGHKRGAFTGADRDRKGYLAAAHGGVLFLDEIGELGADEQALLLTAIEDRRFYPLGADEPVESDFALIAGTNRDLAREVAQGRFRDDLLARIALWTFRLPPLRERREDLAANVRFEAERFEARYHTNVRFTRAALARYLAFARSPGAVWPHNFRDLGQSVTRLCCLANDGVVDVDGVDEEVARLRAAWAEAPAVALAPGSALTAATTEPESAPDAPRGQLDYLDRVMAQAVLSVLARSRTLAEAGRALFDRSRARRGAPNDSDRVRKLCARLGIDGKAHLKG